MKLFAASLLLFAIIAVANPQPELEPTYDVIVYVYKCGVLTRILYTSPRQGMEETNENDGDELNPTLNAAYRIF